jgi:DNA-binding beta-propeller fold protein YncE
MPAFRTVGVSLSAAILLCGTSLNLARAKPFMIVGLDEKVLWDDDGKVVLSPPGKDQVLIVDLADPENPKIAATLPLENTVVGPPVNLDIDPTGSVALVANSTDIVKDGDTLKQVPDNKIFVIDLKANPPKLAATGKHALAVRFPAHKVSVLDVDGGKVSYNKVDLPTGQWPYNVVVTPDSKIALTADNGASGSSDGSVDTSSVIDLEANPPRIIDRVVVGDGPEGLAMSPKGDLAVAAILRGSNMKKAFFHQKNGSLSILKIDGKKVTKTQDIEVGGLPEAVAFTPDGKYLLAGNYLTEDFSILKVDGTEVTDTGKRFKVPGHPASARMGH